MGEDKDLDKRHRKNPKKSKKVENDNEEEDQSDEEDQKEGKAQQQKNKDIKWSLILTVITMIVVYFPRLELSTPEPRPASSVIHFSDGTLNVIHGTKFTYEGFLEQCKENNLDMNEPVERQTLREQLTKYIHNNLVIDGVADGDKSNSEHIWYVSYKMPKDFLLSHDIKTTVQPE